MFGRMVRAFAGTSAPPLAEPRENAAGLEDILAIPSLPLRALFEGHHRRELTNEEAAAQARIAYEAAFEGDPLPIGLWLIQFAPVMEDLARSNSPELQRLNTAYSSTTDVARRKCLELHGDVLPIPDAELLPTLLALGTLVAHGPVDLSWGYGLWLEPVVRAAASRSRSEDLLAEMFGLFGEGPPHTRDLRIAIAERLLPLSGLPRNAVPLLAEHDNIAELRDAARAKIREDAGERLWPAIEAVLDNEPAIIGQTLREAEKNPALKALIALSPKERGQEFSRLLDIDIGLSRYGADKWGLLERHDGEYRMVAVPLEHLRGIGNILGALATRKLVLPDPDGDAARFVGRLKGYWWLDQRRILTFLLDIARSHPSGRTVEALRELIHQPGPALHFDKWTAEIEAMLRDLPIVSPPSQLEELTQALSQKKPRKQPRKRSQAQPEEQPQTQSEEQPQAQSEEQPQAQSEEQPQAQSEEQPQAQSEEQPQAQSEEQPQVQSEEQPQAQAEERPQAQSEEQPQAQSEEQPQAQAEEQPQASSPVHPPAQIPSATPPLAHFGEVRRPNVRPMGFGRKGLAPPSR